LPRPLDPSSSSIAKRAERNYCLSRGVSFMKTYVLLELMLHGLFPLLTCVAARSSPPYNFAGIYSLFVRMKFPVSSN
jgi:hypothetical protein